MRQKNKTVVIMIACIWLMSTGLASVAAKEVSYDKGARRDPFVPLEGGEEVGAGSSSSGLSLEGIIFDPPKNSVVLIGGQAYKSGDVLGDGKVVEIFKDRVIIEQNGEQKTLFIRDAENLQ